jgi:uncharacterized membrane protein
MAGPNFSIGEAIRFAWSTVIANLGLFIVAILIVIAISMFPVIFESWVAVVVSWLLGLVVSLGIMRMCLKFVDGDRGELIDLFETIPFIASYLIASIVVSIVVMIGFILLIIPGILLGVRLQLYGWSVIDKQAGPFTAIQDSWDITRGSFWMLVGFWFVLAGINLLGMLALGIGLLVTAPMSLLATAHVYRQLDRAADK